MVRSRATRATASTTSTGSSTSRLVLVVPVLVLILLSHVVARDIQFERDQTPLFLFLEAKYVAA
eukprot:3376587-Rhodomonas_salina.1